jgi:PhzF family phenazine biosynthesis protein
MRIRIVDAFTDRPMGGNPAAVCLLDGDTWPDERWMQGVAAEMNLSETAFLSKRADGAWDLRWFTPAIEVDLCGHATLASAHVLWNENLAPPDEPLAFHTRSGVLTCHERVDRIEMDFPLRPVVETDAPSGLIDAIGAKPVSAWKNAHETYLLEYASTDDVRGITPDFARLGSDPEWYTCVTAAGGPEGFDFVSRFFAPQAGIDEDPATGSAHCMLADFWMKRSGRTDFRAYQASKRGGVIFARVEGDRVFIGGQAVTVLRGELL